MSSSSWSRGSSGRWPPRCNSGANRREGKRARRVPQSSTVGPQQSTIARRALRQLVVVTTTCRSRTVRHVPRPPGRLDCPLSGGGVIIGAETMKLRLRLVLLLMLPLLLVIGIYSVLRVQQESQARAAGMVRTIQIAVESALAVRGRPQAELVDLLNDLTRGQKSIDGIRLFDRDGHVLAVSTAQASVHPLAGPEVVARVIESGAG